MERTAGSEAGPGLKGLVPSDGAVGGGPTPAPEEAAPRTGERLVFCATCGKQNVASSRFCADCGATLARPPAGTTAPQRGLASNRSGQRQRAGGQYAVGKEPVVTMLLSILIVGLGQFYNGDLKKGALMLAGAIVLGFLTLGLAWVLILIWSAVDAYKVAKGDSPLWT